MVNDISFELKSGQGLAIIGPSGSGKSSLARALVGVWQPARGSIRLDRATLDQWSSEVLGQHIGYLPQDVELFDGSVASNIGRFDVKAKPEAILEAAQAAGVHELILSLPSGYATSDRRAWNGYFGRTAPTDRACACALWKSVPCRARRAKLKS